MAAPQSLRLLAQDADDLAVISAALQDAVTRIGDIQWEPGARRLTLAFNRFRWEAEGGAGERVRAGLQLGGVLDVKARHLRQGAKDAVVELLPLTVEAGETPGGLITFAFAAGGEGEGDQAARRLSGFDGKGEQFHDRVLGPLAQMASLDVEDAAQLQTGAHPLPRASLGLPAEAVEGQSEPPG